MDEPQAKLEIYYKQHCIRVVSRIAEQIKTYDLMKLGNITKMLKLGGDEA